MSFPAATKLFTEAAATRISHEDRAVLKDIKQMPELSDDALAAVIREAMRAGKRSFYLTLYDRNGAELEVLAHRLRESGFDAEASPELPLWAKFLLVERSPGVRIRWNAQELAKQLAK